MTTAATLGTAFASSDQADERPDSHDAHQEGCDLQDIEGSRHSLHDEGSDDSDDDGDDDSDRAISQASSSDEDETSQWFWQRGATCHYFDNYTPKAHNNPRKRQVDFFYQEHLKSGHFSLCEPLAAPHDDVLPEEPPLRAEAPIGQVTHLRLVGLRDKLLSSRHIRLLKVFPPGYDHLQRYDLPSQARRLQCEIYQASLDDLSSDGQPLFAALSYVCGDPTLTQHVRCGREDILTTQNLFEALSHIRHEDCPRLLWADALCIDQKDAEERTHQVGMLHEIYAQAHVVSWLGAGHGMDLKAVASYVSLTARLWTRAIRLIGTADDRMEIARAVIAQYTENFGSKSSRPTHQLPLLEIEQIVKSAYFTRVWVAQEMFLSKSATCQIGHRSVSVAALAASLHVWKYHDSNLTTHSLEDIQNRYIEPSLTRQWGVLYRIDAMRDLALVSTFREGLCADPRDHIYGLSALFEDPSAYPVDYSSSVAQVFCNFTVHCMESTKSLWVFEVCRRLMERDYVVWPNTASIPQESPSTPRPERDFDLPYWCPCWSTDYYHNVRSLKLGNVGRWHACGKRSLSMQRPSPLVIVLTGCVVSNIAWCSTNTVGPRSSARLLFTEAVEFVSGCPRRSSSASSMQSYSVTQVILAVLDVFMWTADRTLMWKYTNWPDTVYDLMQGTPMNRKPRDSLRDLVGPIYLADVAPDLYALADFRIDARVPIDDYEPIVDTLERRIALTSGFCRLFMTENGMLGTGLPGMMAGDVVCILFGGEVPYVLRPTEVEGQYLLIGQCYVEELMEGEAMDMGLPEQEFVLV